MLHSQQQSSKSLIFLSSVKKIYFNVECQLLQSVSHNLHAGDEGRDVQNA